HSDRADRDDAERVLVDEEDRVARLELRELHQARRTAPDLESGELRPSRGDERSVPLVDRKAPLGSRRLCNERIDRQCDREGGRDEDRALQAASLRAWASFSLWAMALKRTWMSQPSRRVRAST